MPPRAQTSRTSQSSRSSQKKSKPGPSRLSKVSTLPAIEGLPEPARKKIKPLSSLVRTPVIDLTNFSDEVEDDDDTPTVKPDIKGKSKGTALAIDDQLWVDTFGPTTAEELAVHPRKVSDVRQWLQEALAGGKLRKYRRILVLTGPAGTGKTATVRVLARELGLEILEWRNTVGDAFQENHLDGDGYQDRMEQESLTSKFASFLARASSCGSIFGQTLLPIGTTSYTSSTQPQTQTVSQLPNSQFSRISSQSSTLPSPPSLPPDAPRHLIFLEDLPNVLHARTQTAVHAELEAFLAAPYEGAAPLVLVVSDTGVRGEVPDERDAADLPAVGSSRGREAVTVRTVLPPELLKGPYVTQIGFNPVAPSIMRRALSALVAAASPAAVPSRDSLERIVEAAEGDVRAAVNALQFACVANKSAKHARGGRSKGGPGARGLLESVTRREHSLALFHLLGRVMYNKRKGDPQPANLSKKDLEKERLADAVLPEPPPLPPYLAEHSRRTSRVDVDALYADSPVDAGLLALYLHQNYVPFCDELSHCAGVADVLSSVDASGGELWHQANPHRFHLLTRGALHALPSPAPRRGQRTYKPVWFERLQQERAAADAVRDTQEWLHSDNVALACGGWKRRDIVLELGGVLRARTAQGSADISANHSLFSSLVFDKFDAGAGELAEEDGADVEEARNAQLEILPRQGSDGESVRKVGIEEVGGGWLEGDEIEEDWD